MLTRLPSLFLGHGGGPAFFLRGGMFAAMDTDSPSANFLRSVSNLLPFRPSALVVISAHWEGESNAIEILTTPSPSSPLLFDYYGFPKETYEIKWSASQASIELISRVNGLLTTAGFETVHNSTRGFDHGVFVPLKLVFPDAEIPTLQISLHRSLDPLLHIALGKALAPLRNEGVLIIGSGFITHNLREISRSDPFVKPYPWIVEFCDWITTILTGSSRIVQSTAPLGKKIGTPLKFSSVASSIVSANRLAPHFSRVHPRTEHWLPLLVALGASDSGDSESTILATEIYQQIILGSASMASYSFDSVDTTITKVVKILPSH
jgi:aromatic ring-opening dioxygenase catalytic subunit (LigB family)